MDRHRRIARTLCCLVASMTIGAVVLDMSQPSYQAGQKPSHQLAALLKKAIDNHHKGSVNQQLWQEIHIYPLDAGSGRKTGNSHFLIDHNGNMSATENWQVQKYNATPGAISIGVLTSTNSNDLSKPQWGKVERLILGLQQLCKIPGNRVIWFDNMASPPSHAGFSQPQVGYIQITNLNR